MERALRTDRPTSINDRSTIQRPPLDEFLTVDEVAALLKVSKSWIYEHTRSRGVPRMERLPCIKLGKYVRFELESVRAYLAARVGSRMGARS